MGRKRLVSALLSCMLLFTCSPTLAMAVEASDACAIMPRVSGQLNYTFPANTTMQIGQPFSAAKDDIVKYDCTYTPKSASMNFGVIAPDGLFYSISCTSGSINQSIKMEQAGQYTLAIRNNESYAVTVTGTIQY